MERIRRFHLSQWIADRRNPLPIRLLQMKTIIDQPYSDFDFDPARGVEIVDVKKERKLTKKGRCAEASRVTRRWVWYDKRGIRHMAWTTIENGSWL
jgi:hypothetical protein